MVVLAAVLTATSGQYGYFRDELYFRMLPTQWGYVDQPPFTPFLVRAMSAVADEVWAVRVPATAAAVCAVLLVALVARELGGGGLAQGLAAWGYAFGSIPLAFGHTTITADWDLVAWVAVSLFVTRAVLRDEPRWWLAAGTVLGLATWNKLLISLLVVSLVAGVAVVGPRRLPWRHLLMGAGLAVVLAVPQLVYQAAHGFPQMRMAGALTQDNGAANRVLFVPFLLIMLGPVLVPVWVTGLVSLLTRPAWRPVRFLAFAFLVALILTLLTGGSPYYVLGLLAVIYAAGCVPVSEWLATSLRRRWLAFGAVGLNALVATVVGLPIIPVSSVGSTPVPGVNQGARDTVGWPEYVEQVARAYENLAPSERAGVVVITTNYGEAGAVARYGPALGLPAVISGHNELADATRPPDGRMPVVVVGRGAMRVASRNASCTEVNRLDNRRGVDNEEQGQPVAVCRQPRDSWLAVWPQFRHLD
jgi:Dolichyl-phosphate-mannose-protein mannosyltransferase